MKRNRRPAAFGNSASEIRKRAMQMAEAAKIAETGLYVERKGNGWAVIHDSSGLPAVTGLRQRRFAEEAMSDLLSTGVDFTRSSREVQNDRVKWKNVYYLWMDRSQQKHPDSKTFEYYSHSTHVGSVIPSAERAAKCRELAESGRNDEALALLNSPKNA